MSSPTTTTTFSLTLRGSTPFPSHPLHNTQAGGLSVLGTFLRISDDSHERAIAAELLCEVLSGRRTIVHTPVTTELPATLSRSRNIPLTTADLRLLVTSLAISFTGRPNAPLYEPSNAPRGEASAQTGALANQLRDHASLTRLGLDDEITVAPACLALQCLPPVSFRTGSPTEQHAETFFAATALGKLAGIQFTGPHAAEVSSCFAYSDVIQRLAAITHSSDTHVCFASCYALKQILGMRPLRASATAACAPPSEVVSRTAVEAGIVPRVLGLLIGRLDDRRKTSALSGSSFDDDSSEFGFLESAEQSEGVIRMALGILDSLLENPSSCRTFVDARGLDCLLLLAAMARDLNDDESGAAALKMAKKIANDATLVATVVKGGAVQVALSFLDPESRSEDAAAPSAAGRLSQVQAVELLELVCRDDGLAKHLMLQPNMSRVFCSILEGPLPSSATETSGFPRRARSNQSDDASYYKVKITVCAIIQRVAFNSPVFAQHLCEHQVAPALITLIRRVNSAAKVPLDRKLQHGAVLALRNICGAHPDLQPYLSSSGLIPPLLAIITAAAEALSTHYHVISELDAPDGDLYDPPLRSVTMAKAETVIPTATEAALQTFNLLCRTHRYIRGQLVRAGIVTPLINVLRFGPTSLRYQCLDICLFLMEDAAVIGEMGRGGLITESIAILDRSAAPRDVSMSVTGRTTLHNTRIRAALALATLAHDGMSRSKIAALGGILAVARFYAANADVAATGAGGPLSVAETSMAAAVAAAAHAESMRAARSAALAALRALCKNHAANYQETLRVLVLQGWLHGTALNLDESPGPPPSRNNRMNN